MAIAEFRQDLVSGHWVLISTERAKRKTSAVVERLHQPKESCPFEDPVASNGGKPSLVFSHGKRTSYSNDWTTLVVRNKYPALQEGVCGPVRQIGPFNVADAFGYHELVITRDHDRSFAQFSHEEVKEVLLAYRERYREIAQDDCGAYILIFHNHGKAAGASLYHHHSQIISTPILPPEVITSIAGAERYHRDHGKRVHDVMLEWELKEGKRIVYENGHFVVLCPYASKTPYEMRIFPKVGRPRFDDISDGELHALADALSVVTKKLYALDNVDYNFYIHTAPVKKDSTTDYSFYHWHIEVVPRVGIVAGFELATAIYINSMDPDQAAQELRKL